jgi:hypothetical protein
MRSGLLMGAMALFALLQGPSQVASPPAEEPPWVTYYHKNAGFSIEHPGDWTEESDKGAISVHFAHPQAPVHLFVAAFVMGEGSLEEFARLKFGVQPEIFEPVGSERKLAGPGWTGLVQEAADKRPGHKDETRRLMLCAGHGDLYVSLTLFADADQLEGKRQYYERIFTSLHFLEPGESPPPGQDHHRH